jgi:hypothetical protein
MIAPHMTPRPALLALALLTLAGAAAAKRAAPFVVAPVVKNGIRYEAPHFGNPCGQNGGCVVAVDGSGAQLWDVKVYCTHYDSAKERDVQDVFITGLSLEGDSLAVSDEQGRHFSIDLDTHAVSGDPSGCNASGCSYDGRPGRSLPAAGVGGVIIAMMMILGKRRRRARARYLGCGTMRR